jgi:hypothetical protein
MSIKIEQGKWYVLNDGQVVGPAEPNSAMPDSKSYPWNLPGFDINAKWARTVRGFPGWTHEGYFSVYRRGHDCSVAREATHAEVVRKVLGKTTTHAEVVRKVLGKTTTVLPKDWYTKLYEGTDLAETMAEEAKAKDARVEQLEARIAEQQVKDKDALIDQILERTRDGDLRWVAEKVDAMWKSVVGASLKPGQGLGVVFSQEELRRIYAQLRQ